MRALSPLRTFRALAALVAIVGCIPPVPPATPIARPPVPVAAPFAKTWEASVDVFADKNIGVRTIDRSSGLIVADPVTVPIKFQNPKTPIEVADCGQSYGRYEQPTNATYNVRVRGDTVGSTVLVTVRWVIAETSISREIACTSTGVWEREFEKLVKEKAEARAH